MSSNVAVSSRLDKAESIGLAVHVGSRVGRVASEKGGVLDSNGASGNSGSINSSIGAWVSKSVKNNSSSNDAVDTREGKQVHNFGFRDSSIGIDHKVAHISSVSGRSIYFRASVELSKGVKMSSNRNSIGRTITNVSKVVNVDSIGGVSSESSNSSN